MSQEINPIKMLYSKQGKRSLREFAEEVGVSKSYLSDLYAGKRTPGNAIMRFLGLRRTVKRVIVYRRNGK